MPVDHLRGAAVQLRVRHGSAHLHAGAEDRRGDGDPFLQVRRSRLHQAGGWIKIRVETISHYLGKYSPQIIQRKLSYLSPHCPLAELNSPTETSEAETARITVV